MTTMLDVLALLPGLLLLGGLHRLVLTLSVLCVVAP